MEALTPIVKVYYGKPMLPNVARVLACLHEKDVKFDLIDMYKDKHMTPDLIKFQASQAPVSGFEDGDTTLFESRAICRHIVNKYAERGNKYLLGRDLLERASIEQWLKLEEHSFDPPSWTLIFHLAFDVQPDRALIRQSERMLSKVLDVYEQRLAESRFLATDEFTLADLSHLPNSHYLARSREWGHLFESRKHVSKWWEEISSRPSWNEAVKILNEVDLFHVPASREYQFLTQSKLDLHSPPLTGDLTVANEALANQTKEKTSREGKTDQQAPTSAQSLTQPAATGAPSYPLQEKMVQQTDSTSQSSAQPSTKDAQSAAKQPQPDGQSSQKMEKTDRPLHEGDSIGQSVNQQANFDTLSSTQLPTAVASSQKPSQEEKSRQADSSKKLSVERSPSQLAPTSDLSSQTRSGQISRQADYSQQSPAQKISPDTESPAQLLSNQVRKEQEKDTQQMRQANATVSSTKKEDSTNALSTSSSQKQEEKSKPMGEADSGRQQTAQKARTDAQPTIQQLATGAQSSEKQENGIQKAHQEDSAKSVAKQATTAGKLTSQGSEPGALSDNSQEHLSSQKNDVPTTHQRDSGKPVVQQATAADKSTSQQSEPGDLSYKDQQPLSSQQKETGVQTRSQEDSGKSAPQQGTAPDKSTTQQSRPGTLSNKDQERLTTQEQANGVQRVPQQDTGKSVTQKLTTRDQPSIQLSERDTQSSKNQEQLSRQKQDNGGQTAREEDAGKSTAQQATRNDQSIAQQSQPNSPSSKKQEQAQQQESLSSQKDGKQGDTQYSIQQASLDTSSKIDKQPNSQSVRQDDFEHKSIPRQQDTADTKSPTEPPSPGAKIDDNTQKTSQEDSSSKAATPVLSGVQSSTQGLSDAKSPQIMEKQAQQTGQTVSQEGATDSKPTPQSPTTGTQSSQKEQSAQKRADQATTKQSSSYFQASSPKAPLDETDAQKREQGAHLSGQGDTKGQSSSQQAIVKQPTLGDPSSQIQGQENKKNLQERSSDQTTLDRGLEEVQSPISATPTKSQENVQPTKAIDDFQSQSGNQGGSNKQPGSSTLGDVSSQMKAQDNKQTQRWGLKEVQGPPSAAPTKRQEENTLATEKKADSPVESVDQDGSNKQPGSSTSGVVSSLLQGQDNKQNLDRGLKEVQAPSMTAKSQEENVQATKPRVDSQGESVAQGGSNKQLGSSDTGVVSSQLQGQDNKQTTDQRFEEVQGPLDATKNKSHEQNAQTTKHKANSFSELVDQGESNKQLGSFTSGDVLSQLQGQDNKQSADHGLMEVQGSPREIPKKSQEENAQAIKSKVDSSSESVDQGGFNKQAGSSNSVVVSNQMQGQDNKQSPVLNPGLQDVQGSSSATPTLNQEENAQARNLKAGSQGKLVDQVFTGGSDEQHENSISSAVSSQFQGQDNKQTPYQGIKEVQGPPSVTPTNSQEEKAQTTKPKVGSPGESVDQDESNNQRGSSSTQPKN